MRPFTDNNDKLQALLTDYALATGPRPPCEARIDPDTCVACTAWTTESLEASVRLWGVGRGRGTVTALVEEVLRLRAERDALRDIVTRLAGDDGMYSDDYGMHCLCGYKRDHGDGCLRAEAQALLGGGER